MRGGTVQINWHDGQPVLTLDFHPQSGLLATGGNDHDIKLWATTPGDSQRKLPSASYQNSLSYHSAAVNVLRFSPSGDLLASGADGGELVIWKLHSTDDGQAWKVLKSLIFHRKDVLDLQWSADSTHLISGSVDNSCIIWDVNKGSVHQILDSHLHYVQGVSWDPLGQYVASLSSDRTCRVYVNKPQSKHKGHEKINYVCQYILTKSETENLDESKNPDESKPPSTKAHLFHDETLPSFFRRLSWSPDGSFLLVPAGIQKYSSASETVNTAYILSRRDLSRPAIQLPGASKPVVAVRFCPVLFCLRGSNSDGYFKLPYRVVFAVATLNSLYMFDTESLLPIAIYAGLHYAAITDIAWSRDAKYLALSSRDGYCTVLEFENDELGVPIPTSEEKKISEGNGDHINIESEVVDSMEIDDIKSSKTDEAMEINDLKSSESDRKTNDIKSSKSDGKTSEASGTKQVLHDGKSVEGSDVRQVLSKEINEVKSSESDRKTKEPSGTNQVLRDGDGKAVEGSVVRLVLPTSTEALDDNKPKKKRITPVAIN